MGGRARPNDGHVTAGTPGYPLPALSGLLERELRLDIAPCAGVYPKTVLGFRALEQAEPRMSGYASSRRGLRKRRDCLRGTLQLVGTLWRSSDLAVVYKEVANW